MAEDMTAGKDTDNMMYNQLRKFINVIDELRDVGLQKYISLPKIAVLGGQSAGKSSVLESIVGLDFLPRAAGLCTRRPLEMRLNHASEDAKPYAVFPDEIPGQKFTNMKEVQTQIVALTDKVCGNNSNIVDKPIVLQVFSHTCPDLTLIDLPGITRVPTQGQPENIEQITKAMCNRYMSDPRTIILCVVPANADLAISDGLMMAKQLDPKGVRTIGVITKVDIMDRGVNAKRAIMGQDIPLRLGYVGVKNRAQEDIENALPVKEAIAKEQMFFSTHPVYSSMPPGYLGCDVLTQKCTRILFTHIKHNLPEIIREIRDRSREAEGELRDLGPAMPSSSGEKMHLLWNMITEFVTTYKDNIQGKYDPRRMGGPQSGPLRAELSGGSKIKMLCYRLYSEFDGYNATQEYSDIVIERAIAMHEGDSIPGFPSVDVFYYLLQPQLEKLREPALDLLQDVYGHLEMMAQGIIDRIFMRFPALRPVIMDIIIQLLQGERDHAREMVESIISAEQNYIFTNDTGFKENKQSNVQEIAQEAQQQQRDAQGRPIQGAPPGGNGNDPRNPNGPPVPAPTGTNVFVRELRTRIDNYFRIVLRNVRDTIPKMIGYFMVRMSQNKLQFELYNKINNNPNIADALGEPKAITERRATLTGIIKTLNDSLKVLQRDPDITAAGSDDSELSAALKEEDQKRRQEQNNRPPPNNMPPPNSMQPPPNNRPPPNNMPPNNMPPQNRPPGNMPPGNMPPGNRPPGNMPPGNMPPGNRPPGNMPPGNMPPGNRPPGNMPPTGPPPGNQPRGPPPGGAPNASTGNLFGNPLGK